MTWYDVGKASRLVQFLQLAEAEYIFTSLGMLVVEDGLGMSVLRGDDVVKASPKGQAFPHDSDRFPRISAPLSDG